MFNNKNKKRKLPHEVMIITDNRIEREEVLDYFDNTVEIEEKMLSVSESKQYINSNGGITFVFNMDEPALVEASNLKKLRRSLAIQRIFDFDKEKPVDFVKIGLFAVIIVALMF